MDLTMYIPSIPRTIILDAICCHPLSCPILSHLLQCFTSTLKKTHLSERESRKFQWISNSWMLTCRWDGKNAVVDTSFPCSWHKLGNSLTYCLFVKFGGCVINVYAVYEDVCNKELWYEKCPFLTIERITHVLHNLHLYILL